MYTTNIENLYVPYNVLGTGDISVIQKDIILALIDVTVEGEQNRPHQNVPLWHVNYFELKKIKVQKTQEEIFTSPLTAVKNLEKGSG